MVSPLVASAMLAAISGIALWSYFAWLNMRWDRCVRNASESQQDHMARHFRLRFGIAVALFGVGCVPFISRLFVAAVLS